MYVNLQIDFTFYLSLMVKNKITYYSFYEFFEHMLG